MLGRTTSLNPSQNKLTMTVVAMIIFVAALCYPAKSQPRCLFEPLPAPEVDYDFYICSYVLDWSRNFPKICKEATTRYEVQFIYGCTNDSLHSQNFTTIQQLSIPDEVLKLCFATGDSNCYARVRAQLNDMSWSEYSAWATLSDSQHETVQGKHFI